MVVHSRRGHARTLRLLLIVLIELLDVEAASTLVDVDIAIDRALYLNCLGAVALLRVQLTSITPHIHWLDLHHFTAHATVAARGVVRRAHDRLASRIVAKVRLVHQLLVKGRVDGGVVVGDGVGVDLGVAILEQLVEDRLLLIVVDIHTLALDGTAFNSNAQKG